MTRGRQRANWPADPCPSRQTLARDRSGSAFLVTPIRLKQPLAKKISVLPISAHGAVPTPSTLKAGRLGRGRRRKPARDTPSLIVGSNQRDIMAGILSGLLWTAVGLVLATSYKYLPLAYQVRFWSLPIRYIYVHAPPAQAKPNPSAAFVRSSYCCPLECDLFGFHKTNSSYFVELDLARTETMLHAFHWYFYKERPFVPLAEIRCLFLKEIAPFQRYDVVSKVVAIGTKWVYLVSIFTVRDKGGLQVNVNGTSLRACAISVGKLVFKNGRKTINVNEIVPEQYKKVLHDNEQNVLGSSTAEELISLFNSV